MRPEIVADDTAGNLPNAVEQAEDAVQAFELFVVESVFLLQPGPDEVPGVAVQVQEPRREAGQQEDAPADFRGALASHGLKS